MEGEPRKYRRPARGFVTLFQISPEMLDFLSAAELGPRVDGSLETIYRTHRQKLYVEEEEEEEEEEMEMEIEAVGERLLFSSERRPVSESLTPSQDRLQTALFSLQPNVGGSPNPLYGIVKSFNLTALLSLHAHYSGMTRMKSMNASTQMRQYLAPLMERVINRDIQKIIQEYPDNPAAAEAIQNVGQQMIQNINDPGNVTSGVLTDSSGREVSSIFNPNSFKHWELSKFVSAARGPDIVNLDKISFEQYDLILQTRGELKLDSVLQVQDDYIRMALGFKNLSR